MLLKGGTVTDKQAGKDEEEERRHDIEHTRIQNANAVIVFSKLKTYIVSLLPYGWTGTGNRLLQIYAQREAPQIPNSVPRHSLFLITKQSIILSPIQP